MIGVYAWMNRAGRTALGLLLVATTLAGFAHAGGSPPPLAPEIDPGSIGSAMTLLIGGACWLTGRSKKG